MTPAFEQDTLVFLPRIDRMAPRRLDSAFFGMEHFYDSEPRFGVIKGVWRTVAGYSGGRYESPSCEDLGDHMEAVRVEYDPAAISYGQLLDIFLNCCGCREDPPHQCVSCVSRVFVKTEFERRLAQAAVSRYELRFGVKDYVRVAAGKTFYQAESWRQKHFLRMLPRLMDELRRMYPDEDCMLQSTLATRLNGMLWQRTLGQSMLEQRMLGQRAIEQRMLGESLFREFSERREDFEFFDLTQCAVDILRSVMG